MKTVSIPDFVRGALWSYDINRMDLERDKVRIITNVLNYGTKSATDWLRATYSADDIASVVTHPRSGEWNKKSLNFWSLIYQVTPQITERL